jgi:hypothetical protein
MKRLPKKFRGANVVRGLGLDHKKFEALEERYSCAEWDASRTMYVVVNDTSLGDGGPFSFKAFFDRDKAIRYARACGNGNMDQRVLTVTSQTLVVATDNDL